MRMLRILCGLLVAGSLTACGGGGGSAGTGATTTSGSTTSTTTTTTTVATPSIAMSLVSGTGSAVAGNAVTSGSTVFAQVTLKNASGAAVANRLVAFISGSGLLTFLPVSGQVLTDAAGIAKVQVVPATTSSGGAETLSANATIEAKNLSASLDVQTAAANVSLSSLTAGQTTLTAFQAASVSVNVAVNGVPASATPVSVSFSSSCGTFSPTSAMSNSSGKAISTFQATGCAGGVATLSATAQGAGTVQTTVTVQSPAATNILFSSAMPSTIYSSAASFGDKQSTVKFKIVDASSTGIAGVDVRVSLSTSSIAAGVVFADSNLTTPKTVSTSASGEVSVIVKSGALPTPLTLNAELVSNPLIAASSAGLSVNSGRPVQNFFSLSASIFNIEGWSYDNVSTNINVLLADRLGQPVPAGTPISFISEGGQVTASCSVVIDSNNKSGCTVSLISQAFRPLNGRISVLAYTEGEEAFEDSNGNNKYDVGETFYDMGQPFLDANENLVLNTTEQKVGDPSVLGSGIGSSACTTHPYLTANVANTCGGAWGSTRVRGEGVIVFSTSFAGTTTFPKIESTGVTLELQDLNGNAMPSGTVVAATISGGTNCSVVEVIPAAVPNGPNPSEHRVIITKGSAVGDTCVGAEVTMKATTPKGNVTLLGSEVIPSPVIP